MDRLFLLLYPTGNSKPERIICDPPLQKHSEVAQFWGEMGKYKGENFGISLHNVLETLNR